ncbi:MAG TPA: histidinol-phosphate transaminase [Bacteroidales bacterium]|nr:histidinol-phosphate transaminase [Bacteroidales bacterium]
MKLTDLVRPNILHLKPYSSARDEFQGDASVFLDANENPLNNPYNRYPDPLQRSLKQRVAALKGVGADRLFFGNGSDEPIDLIFRVFCEPGRDNVVAIDPTYGMYRVSADINNVSYKTVHLNPDFSLDATRLLAAVDEHTKVIFLCSPNNPTGNDLEAEAVKRVLDTFKGITVIDEAYVDFADRPSYLSLLDEYPHLIVLQTFSKAWGMASVRLGMAFADPTIIRYFNTVKYPYNINLLTQRFVFEALDQADRTRQWVAMLLAERSVLAQGLGRLPLIKTVYPSDANFVLVKVDNPNAVYTYLVDKGIVVRNRHTVSLCEGCLRITVGTSEENKQLLDALAAYA